MRSMLSSTFENSPMISGFRLTADELKQRVEHMLAQWTLDPNDSPGLWHRQAEDVLDVLSQLRAASSARHDPADLLRLFAKRGGADALLRLAKVEGADLSGFEAALAARVAKMVDEAGGVAKVASMLSRVDPARGPAEALKRAEAKLAAAVEAGGADPGPAHAELLAQLEVEVAEARDVAMEGRETLAQAEARLADAVAKFDALAELTDAASVAKARTEAIKPLEAEVKRRAATAAKMRAAADNAVLPVVEGAAKGEVDAWHALAGAASKAPRVFPAGFADRLVAAATEAFIEDGAKTWSGLIARA